MARMQNGDRSGHGKVEGRQGGGGLGPCDGLQPGGEGLAMLPSVHLLHPLLGARPPHSPC